MSSPNLLIEREREFWQHVEDGTPPEVKTIADAVSRWPKDSGVSVVATPEIAEAVVKLAEVKDQLTALEADADALSLAIRTCMAEATVLTDSAPARSLATWKAQVRSQFDFQAFKAAHPGLYAQFTVKHPTRVFQTLKRKTAMNAVTATPRPSLVRKIANRYDVDPDKMLETLKATVFKGNVSNEQMMALLIVADRYQLDPFTREIFAFPDKQSGVIPVVSVDGWSSIVSNHPQSNGYTLEDENDEQGNPIACKGTMWRKDYAHPVVIREYFREVKRDTGPWKSHPHRMLRHKTFIQLARMDTGVQSAFPRPGRSGADCERRRRRESAAASRRVPSRRRRSWARNRNPRTCRTWKRQGLPMQRRARAAAVADRMRVADKS